MKKVLLRAPLLSISGYGVHSRQIFKWLESRKDIDLAVNIVQWGDTTWMLNSEMEDGMIGRIMSKSLPMENPDVTFQVQLPDEWDPNLGKINVGISAWIETDKCNPAWIEASKKMDLLIVPTEFTKNVIENTGDCGVPLEVVGESYNDKITEEDDIFDLDIDTDFNFLMVGQFTGNDPLNDRKNLFYTIKWLCEEFKDDPSVGIIFKTNRLIGNKNLP